MSGIKYYALRTDEEPPMGFVVIRHVDGEPEFVASYINSSCLSYENGVLLKMHERNDALRAENAKLRELCVGMWEYVKRYADTLDAEVHGYIWPYNTHGYGDKVRNGPGAFGGFPNRMRELGVEVDA